MALCVRASYQKPEVKAFKRWVTHEVLLSIRKHGVCAMLETAEKLMGATDFCGVPSGDSV